MKKVNVAVIGCGCIANAAHIPSYLSNPDAQIKYFCDIIPEKADAAVKKYGCGEAVYDYRQILNDPEIDAVSVCTPNKMHSEISIDFLLAGKHVLCEKPAARVYDEAKKILSDFLSSDEGWTENNIEACKILSLCFVETDEPFSALEALTRTFRYDIPRAETCCEIGNIFMSLENYRTAAFWYELALGLPKECKSGAFFSEDCHGFFPCIQLCVCYDRLGEFQKARDFNEKAGRFKPESQAYQFNKAYYQKIFPKPEKNSMHSSAEDGI